MSTAPKTEAIDAPYVKGHAAPLVAITDIHPSPSNPRKNLGDLTELIASVKRHGVLQPVLARPNNKGFELVSGHRRLAATKAAGLKEIPCIVREINDREVLEIQLVENCQRVDIHPLEEADAYQQLHAIHNVDIDALAAKVGKSKAYVYRGRDPSRNLRPSPSATRRRRESARSPSSDPRERDERGWSRSTATTRRAGTPRALSRRDDCRDNASGGGSKVEATPKPVSARSIAKPRESKPSLTIYLEKQAAIEALKAQHLVELEAMTEELERFENQHPEVRDAAKVILQRILAVA